MNKACRAWAAKLLWALVVWGPSAWALPADYGLSQLYHTQWTVQEGVPTGIEAMAQTADGFLWLGSIAGLFRFDGVAFERMAGINGTPLLSQDIFSLHASADGGLCGACTGSKVDIGWRPASHGTFPAHR